MPTAHIPPPERWDVPFSPEMTDGDVDRLLTIAPFSDIDADRFRGKVTLRGILKNDARIVAARSGDIIIREGDWGDSAFFILSGTARVELESGGLPPEVLGRRPSRQKSLFGALAQLWRNHREPEARDLATTFGAEFGEGVGMRGSGQAARMYLQDVPAVLDAHRTVQLTPGQFFGELAALGRIPRTATVFADADAELLEIRWQGLRDIMRRDDAIRRQIDTVFRERALRSFLRGSRIFQHLSDEELSRLADAAQLESYGAYDSAGGLKALADSGAASDLRNEPVIAAEGDYPNGVILIRSGLARLSHRHHHGHRTVGYLTPGHAYGFDELLQSRQSRSQIPLQYSLRAIGYVTLVVVPTPIVEKLVLARVLDEGAGEAAGESAATQRFSEVAVPVDAGLLEFLVERRLINGTASMIIDLDRCTRCDDCVRACASTHDGNPRFLRHGPVHGRYMVANACMHCEDPVCMIECPTGAIHRDLSGGEVIVNDLTCIGCGACASNCPYDAIRMVQVRNLRGAFIREENRHEPIRKATKCDLCDDQLGGPACQRACPHDALQRIDMSQLDQVAAWTNR